MMNYNDLDNWVLEQGGPAIQLRIYSRQLKNKSMNEIESAASKLLSSKKVNKILDFLDAFKTQSRDKKTLEHLIHYYKETCIDNFFPLLLDLGFIKGIPIFDEKLKPLIKLFSDLLADDHNYSYYYSFMLHRFFSIAGYEHPDLLVDDIIEYILDPEFQKIPEYYGLLWFKSKRMYHACGWGPALPLYEDFYRPRHISAYSVQ